MKKKNVKKMTSKNENECNIIFKSTHDKSLHTSKKEVCVVPFIALKSLCG